MSKGSITLALVMAGRPFGDIVDKELNNWQKDGNWNLFFFFLRQENSKAKNLSHLCPWFKL